MASKAAIRQGTVRRVPSRISWLLRGLLASLALAGCGSPNPPLEAAVYAGPVKINNQSMGGANQSGGVNQTANGVGPAGAAVDLTAAPQPPSGPVPPFQVIAQRMNDRPDDAISYYVVIDPVDVSFDGFKSAVKQVLQALAHSNGGPVFTAQIWDHLPAAQTEVSHRSNPDLFSQDLFEAKESLNNRHFIAQYVGGLASVAEPPAYVLMWFPVTGPADPTVAQWVSAEVWRP